MKKTILFLLTLCLLLGAAIPAFADAPAADSLDSHLILHYDFEGETLNEQLSDKAPAGKSNDKVTIYNTVEGYADLTVADGIAHIQSHPNPDTTQTNIPYISNGFVTSLSGETETAGGADIVNNQTGEFTFWANFRVKGDGLTKGGFRDFFRLSETTSSHLFRIYTGNCNTENKTKEYFFVSGALSAKKIATLPYESDAFVHLAVTMAYNEKTSKWDYKGYLSMDEGQSFLLVMEDSADNAKDFYAKATQLSFGNRNVKGFTEYDFDDFRVYDKALTADELASVNRREEPTTEEPSTEAPTTEAPTGKAPTTPAASEDHESKPGDSETAPAGSNDKGCASAIGAGVLCPLLLALGVCGIARKKKRED